MLVTAHDRAAIEDKFFLMVDMEVTALTTSKTYERYETQDLQRLQRCSKDGDCYSESE